MHYRRLGRSGLVVSELALGNWVTHGAQVDNSSAHAVVHAALDAGITTFDTADSYAAGRAESVLGSALAGYARDAVVLSTKTFWPLGAGSDEGGLSRRRVMDACHASLRRLRTDYVDLYQAHRFDMHTPVDETLRAFDDLVRDGKVRYVGVSEWTAQQIGAAAAIASASGFAPLVSNQPQYSMLWRVIEEDILPACDALGIGQIVWSPLAQGVLSGKYLPGAGAPAGSRGADSIGADYIDRWLGADVLTAVQGLVPIAADVGLTPAQMALAWVLQNPSVSAAIIGASRPAQIAENVRASGVTLAAATMAAIDDALEPVVRWRRPVVEG